MQRAHAATRATGHPLTAGYRGVDSDRDRIMIVDLHQGWFQDCSNDVYLDDVPNTERGRLLSVFRLVGSRMDAQESNDGCCRRATPQSALHYSKDDIPSLARCTQPPSLLATPAESARKRFEGLRGCKAPPTVTTAVTRIQLEEAKSTSFSPPRPWPCGK